MTTTYLISETKAVAEAAKRAATNPLRGALPPALLAFVKATTKPVAKETPNG